MRKKITGKTRLTEILSKPLLVKKIAEYNFPCLSCPFIIEEMENLTIGDVCKRYGIDKKSLLKELNSVLK